MRDEITGNFDEMYVIAEATLDNGEIITAQCDGPRGKWGTPPITEEEHLIKIHDCLSLKFNEQKRNEIIKLSSRFDELSTNQIKKLMNILAG